jgi:hypothetical protein
MFDVGKTIFVSFRKSVRIKDNQRINPAVLVAVFYVLCMSTLLPAYGQNSPWRGFGIEVNYMGGQIFKHTQKFRGPVPPLSTAIEVNFIQQTFGREQWHQQRHFPIIGAGITYTDYGVDSIYGKCISMYPNLQVPLLKSKYLEWTCRVGFGLGYVTKHYERAPIWDTLNNAIGSHGNNYTILATDLRFRINEHWDVQAGGNFSHISNASFRTPNLGINLLGGHVGLRYFPVTSKPEKIITAIPPLKNRWLAQVRFGIAANEYGQANGPLYPVYLLSGYISRRYHGKNKVFAGLDYSYHKGVYAFLRNNEIYPGEEKKHSWKSSVFVGNEFLVGTMGIVLQLGVYVKEAALREDPYYQKLGSNIYLFQNESGTLKEAALAVLLKTHKFQAELVEVGFVLGF